MKLLARTARDLRRLGSPGGGFTLLVLAVALALEVLGRQSDSDLQDLLAASTLSLVGMLVALSQRFQGERVGRGSAGERGWRSSSVAAGTLPRRQRSMWSRNARLLAGWT